jgi:hypothetical protein
MFLKKLQGEIAGRGGGKLSDRRPDFTDFHLTKGLGIRIDKGHLPAVTFYGEDEFEVAIFIHFVFQAEFFEGPFYTGIGIVDGLLFFW